jgi:hypothetical protein
MMPGGAMTILPAIAGEFAARRRTGKSRVRGDAPGFTLRQAPDGRGGTVRRGTACRAALAAVVAGVTCPLALQVLAAPAAVPAAVAIGSAVSCMVATLRAEHLAVPATEPAQAQPAERLAQEHDAWRARRRNAEQAARRAGDVRTTPNQRPIHVPSPPRGLGPRPGAEPRMGR